MIILDTNVLSELMHNRVINWLDRQPAESIWITCITLFEARYGLALLPDGKRRSALVAAFDDLLRSDLEQRILNFDPAAAEKAAQLAARRRNMGRPVDIRDTQIAGICEARQATLATRHFEDLSAPLVNPWESG